MRSTAKNVNFLRFNRYSVFALGNSSYPKFCAYGQSLDSLLNSLGAERIFNVGLGDELCGQEESFNSWVSSVFKVKIFIFHVFTSKHQL